MLLLDFTVYCLTYQTLKKKNFFYSFSKQNPVCPADMEPLSQDKVSLSKGKKLTEFKKAGFCLGECSVTVDFLFSNRYFVMFAAIERL